MDEPFSALDVLTAETLRTDFLDLWGDGQLPIKGVILVTHNIEEAVLMCDRILVFSTNPGRIVSEITVDLPQPRNRLDPRFRDLVERIYVEMTARPAAAAGCHATTLPGDRHRHHPAARLRQPAFRPDRDAGRRRPTTARPTCRRSPSHCTWRSTTCSRSPRRLQMLRLAEIEGGDIRLTDAGRQLRRSRASTSARRSSQRQLLTYVPLAAHIRRVLHERIEPRGAEEPLPRRARGPHEQRGRRGDAAPVTAWARYAEAFAYDDDSQTFSLENPT